MITDIKLPRTISKLIQGRPTERITIGYSNAEIYRVFGKDRNYYLKFMPTGKFTSICYEAAVTKWLHGRLPVAEVIEYSENEYGEFLLITEIQGVSAAAVPGMEPEEIVRLYAEGLRMIHAIPTDDCPFDQNTSVKIVNCLYNLDHDLVKLEYLHESRQGMDQDQLRQALMDKQLPVDDLVFTHGDYCFPNVIVSGGRINGFIDFSAAGVADRYQDLAVGGRSTAYNMKLKYNMNDQDAERFVRLFFQEYGLDHVDEEKVDLFLLIDDFHR